MDGGDGLLSMFLVVLWFCIRVFLVGEWSFVVDIEVDALVLLENW